MKEKILTAKALHLQSLKLMALEKALQKLNLELYNEYKYQLANLKTKHTIELDSVDGTIHESIIGE